MRETTYALVLAAGMKDWAAQDWVIFFGALGTFLAVTLTPFMYKIVDMIRQVRQIVHEQEVKASTSNAIANTKADAAVAASKDNADRIIEISQNMTPPNASPIIIPVPVSVAGLPTQMSVPQPIQGRDGRDGRDAVAQPTPENPTPAAASATPHDRRKDEVPCP